MALNEPTQKPRSFACGVMPKDGGDNMIHLPEAVRVTLTVNYLALLVL
jgi:hypothetical protein